MVASPEYTRLLDALLLQASLVDDFLPRDLLREVLPAEQRGNIVLQGQLMSALREQSSTHGDRWQMRPIARRKVLKRLTPPDMLPDTEISSALKAQSIYSDENLLRLIEDEASVDTLSVAVTTLEQAGPAAPGHAYLLALSNKLDQTRREQATDALLGDDFVGRQDEIGRLLEVLDTPQRGAPLQTLHIQGLPGVGKTFLLEELSRQCRARPRIVMVRLDFDRSSLSSGARDAVYDEISRQIGIAMPSVAKELHALRRETAERRTRIATKQAASVPFELLYRMIDILAEHDRQLLFLLDTLEVLHGRGATFVTRLLNDIDRFGDKERIDISLISAGRGAIFPEHSKRLLGLMRLEQLDDDVTQAILIKRGVPSELHERIMSLSGGNPLRLILVARALQEDGSGGDLGDAQIRDAGNGYLYRAILSRVPTDIREIAAEGMVLPELGEWELREIVGPALGLTLDDDRVHDLMEMLEMQRWMIRQVRPGVLAQVSDVRREMLELTYAERAAETRRINERALDLLREADLVRALYHQLQLSRDGGEMPVVQPELALQLTEDLLADLTEDALNEVLRARGQRSRTEEPLESAGPAASSSKRIAQRSIAARQQPDLWLRSQPEGSGGRLVIVDAQEGASELDFGAMADLRNMLDARERREATFVARQLFARPFRFEGEAGKLALVHQWQTGHWSMVKLMLNHLPEEVFEAAIASEISLYGSTFLEAFAELRFDEMCQRMEDPKVLDAAEYALTLTQRSGLRGGALAFAQLAVRGVEAASELGGMGMVSRYLPPGPSRFDLELAERANAMRSEFGLDLKAGHQDPEDLNAADFAAVVAPLNPYIEPIRALLEDLSDAADCKLLRDMSGLGRRLTELAGHYASEVEGVSAAEERTGPYPSEVAELLGALGLTAELAGGYTLHSPIPDLPTIARAAERWQQATLGKWRFGRNKPEGWQEAPVDELALMRAEAMLGSGEGVSQAIRQLRIWDDPGSDVPEGNALRHRLSRPYAKIADTSGLEDKLALLAKLRVAQVYHAPLAVLAELGTDPKEIF